MISVIIPVLNGIRYLSECIASIDSQEMETEIIVVDDASTDGTGELASRLGAKVIRNDVRRGQIVGKNLGIRSATGEYILTIDHDDKLREGALRRLMGELSSCESHVGAVMAKVQDFCSPDTPEEAKYVKREPFFGILTGSTLFRRELFDKVGFFREDLHTGDVLDLLGRCKSAGVEIKKLDYIAADRRIHRTNFGRTNRETEFKDYAKILRDRLLAARKQRSTGVGI